MIIELIFFFKINFYIDKSQIILYNDLYDVKKFV
jgi:hypothetical protein